MKEIIENNFSNKSYILNKIDYFVEWGPIAWRNLTFHAIHNCLGEKYLKGKKLLEIGTHNGKMATLFALLGADVTAIDIDEKCLITAKKEAEKFNIHDRINFLPYDGNLNIFPDKTFDIVFTKSVLVVVPELNFFLQSINKKLKHNGKAIFIENGKGIFLIHWLRKLKNRSWNYNRVNYFSQNDVITFKNIFNIKEIKKTLFPPIFLIFAEKNNN